jgi:hypothetical protein
MIISYTMVHNIRTLWETWKNSRTALEQSRDGRENPEISIEVRVNRHNQLLRENDDLGNRTLPTDLARKLHEMVMSHLIAAERESRLAVEELKEKAT